MEKDIFHRPEVSGELKKLVEARLHTDRDSPWLAQILELQKKYTGTRALPIYVIVDPQTEEPIAKFSGSTFDPSKFAAFLRRATAD